MIKKISLYNKFHHFISLTILLSLMIGMKRGKRWSTWINLGRKKWQQLSNRRGSPRPSPCRTWQPSRRQPRWWSTGRAPWTSPCCISPVQGRPFHPPTITLWWYSTRRQAFFFSLSINSRSKTWSLTRLVQLGEKKKKDGRGRERDSRSRWCKLPSRIYITHKLPRDQQRAIHNAYNREWIEWEEEEKRKTIFCLCVVTYVLVTVYFLHAQRISLSLQLKTTRDKTG